MLNTSWLALDYHCEQGRGDKTALIYDSPVTGQRQTYSYQALRDQVAKIAGMLSNQGVTKGDRVEMGMPVGANQQGFVALKRPLPPSCLPTVWRNHDRFEAGYLSQFPSYYVSGDGGYLDEEGYLFIMGRIDDVINVAGHRLSTGEMEEIVGGHPAIAECAVVGIHDELKVNYHLASWFLKMV